MLNEETGPGGLQRHIQHSCGRLYKSSITHLFGSSGHLGAELPQESIKIALDPLGKVAESTFLSNHLR
jgi:hypothetical protein